MDEFSKLLAKKKAEGKEMSPERMKAKMGVLGELRSMANDSIGKDIPSLKKVTVASPTKEGLEAGLEKAEEVVEGEDMGEMASEEGEHGGSEAYDAACQAAESLSPEEKQKLIAKLSAESEEDESEMMA